MHAKTASMKSPGVLLALCYCLLLSGIVVQSSSAGDTVEETPRTSRFEPERKSSRFRNGGRTRTPKQRTSTTPYGETQRPKFGTLWPSYNPYSAAANAKNSQALSGNGLIEAGETSLSGLGLSGGLQSTQLPPSSTTPRNSEFLKGRSKIIINIAQNLVVEIFTLCRVVSSLDWGVGRLARRKAVCAILCLDKSKCM